MFSFNAPAGACPDCDGLGTKQYFEANLVIHDERDSLADGAIRPWLSLDRHMQILRSLWEQRPGDLYPAVQEPVLIAPADGGGGDWAARKHHEVEAAQAALPNARVHWFTNTDHEIGRAHV